MPDAERYRLFGILRVHDAFDDQRSLPAVAVHLHLVPGEGPAHLAPGENEDLRKRGVVAGIGAQTGKTRDAVFPERHDPSGRPRDLHQDAGLKTERAGDAGCRFAWPRGAQRQIERQHQRAAAGGFGAPHQVEADRMAVPGKAIKLKPEDVRGDLSDLFDRGAAGGAQSVRNARVLGGAGEMQVRAGPHDRRPAHRRHPNRGAVAPAEQLDIAGRQRRHNAIARHQLDGVERRPIAADPGIVIAGAAVGVFEGKMRNAAARTPPQIIDTRIMPMQLRITRVAAMAREQPVLRCDDGGRVVHGASLWAESLRERPL